MNTINSSGLNIGFRSTINYLDERTQGQIQEQYRIQNKEVAEERNMMRERSGFRQEDRNGVFIRSKEGDTAQFSYTAINFQRNANAAEVGQQEMNP